MRVGWTVVMMVLGLMQGGTVIQDSRPLDMKVELLESAPLSDKLQEISTQVNACHRSV